MGAKSKFTVADGAFELKGVSKGKFTVFGHTFDTNSISRDHCRWLIERGFKGLRELKPPKQAESK